MMIIRPIAQDDLDDFYQLALNTGFGVTTLPANKELLAARIALSEKSFAQTIDKQKCNYMFALEDTEQQRIVGVSAIEAYVGFNEVWYNYRVSKNVNASNELGVHTTNETLYITNDMTGSSEVCSLFLDADYRQGNNGRFLSKVRFLFMRDFRELFSDKVFAEMRGVSDAEGRSPFWDSLGQKFFKMDFSKADYLSGLGNKSFVAELMPKHPIYTAFLSQEARDVIGQVHENTRPALEMLKREGFNYNGFIDIFDGGPAIEAFVDNVRAVRESAPRQVIVAANPPTADEDSRYYLVSNSSLENFRAMLVPDKAIRYDTVSITADDAELLKVTTGDHVRIVPLRYQERK